MSSIIIQIILDEDRRNDERNNMRVLRRHMRDSQNPFETLTDDGFFDLYRFPKHLCRDLIDKLNPFLTQTQRIHAIPTCTKVLSALRFFATGSYQRAVGQDVMATMSQTLVSRSITEVAEAINMIANQYLKFPSEQELINTKQKFYNIASFPAIIGLIDGTHIKITAPKKEIEHVYYCRKGGHSKNVQIICDANYIILGINARFGGTTHDSYIWRRSNFKNLLEEKYVSGERNFWLLGDSGYPLQPWLMTPILTPHSVAEEQYNVAHKITRSLVERCIGILKARFRCLAKERALNYTPPKAGKIINACAVLHNILMISKVAVPDIIEDQIAEENLSIDHFNSEATLAEGRRIQRNIVESNFL